MKTNQEPLLAVIDAVKKFGDLVVLDHVNLNVMKQQILVICGPSGAGKSTLLRCINGLELLDSGKIVFDGVVVNRKTARIVRRSIGMVFQSFALFPHMTVLENITIGPLKVLKRPREKVLARAMELLAKVGLSDKVRAYPRQLSGGQQQRVAIVRALMMEPKLILFDEPTSALDVEMIKEVLDVIRLLKNEGMTMVIVTHELGFAREVADLIAFMEAGRIIELADPVNFFENPTSERTKRFLSQVLKP